MFISLFIIFVQNQMLVALKNGYLYKKYHFQVGGVNQHYKIRIQYFLIKLHITCINLSQMQLNNTVCINMLF